MAVAIPIQSAAFKSVQSAQSVDLLSLSLLFTGEKASSHCHAGFFAQRIYRATRA